MSRQTDITEMLESDRIIIADDNWRDQLVEWLNDFTDEEVVEILRACGVVLAIRMGGEKSSAPSLEGVYHWTKQVAKSFYKGTRNATSNN